MYQKIVKDVFTRQEVKWDCLLALFAQFYDTVVEILSLTDHRTYHAAKRHILNLPCNHLTPPETSSKNSKPKHEANSVSLWNGNKDKKKKKQSSSSSNLGGMEYNWYRKY
jgi:hypothetical protein